MIELAAQKFNLLMSIQDKHQEEGSVNSFWLEDQR